jgi:NitT/TauT family transport system ATP-binding protein
MNCAATFEVALRSSNRPATIREIVNIDVPRPRDLDSPGYLEERDRIFRVMGMSLRVGETAAA